MDVLGTPPLVENKSEMDLLVCNLIMAEDNKGAFLKIKLLEK